MEVATHAYSLLVMARSSSMEYQIDAATHLRKILSVERDPPTLVSIEEVLYDRVGLGIFS